MSRPNAAERDAASAELIKAASARAEITTVIDVLDGVIVREVARFGQDSEVAEQLMRASKILAGACQDAHTRVKR